MTETVAVNLNDWVRVRLTDYGREVIREQNREWTKKTGHEFTGPEEDDDGWTRWQLWSLIERFAGHVTMGGVMPYETGIKIERRG